MSRLNWRRLNRQLLELLAARACRGFAESPRRRWSRREAPHARPISLRIHATSRPAERLGRFVDRWHPKSGYARFGREFREGHSQCLRDHRLNYRITIGPPLHFEIEGGPNCQWLPRHWRVDEPADNRHVGRCDRHRHFGTAPDRRCVALEPRDLVESSRRASASPRRRPAAPPPSAFRKQARDASRRGVASSRRWVLPPGVPGLRVIRAPSIPQSDGFHQS